ncbi:hypothetical protein [Oceanobacter kriegii]|uniref:hypothetical protein n=1 Tax=Oceanobacter kriegii TaxID=64972 RepID=UPI0004842436|nr:hypothetical protein [Oceanobacter kriegii]
MLRSSRFSVLSSLSCAAVAAVTLTTSVLANPALEGEKHVYLLDKQGNEYPIGSVHFTAADAGSKYSLHMEHERFKDFFLSMKEMKCLEGPELMCHLAYPYDQPRTVTEQELGWLSHDLLFMYKQPAEFGANFWNGVYYQLRIEGGVIKGNAQAVDLNMLASPPDDLSVLPFGEWDREELEPKNRWLPFIEIR